jgi:hypothetical protein
LNNILKKIINNKDYSFTFTIRIISGLFSFLQIGVLLSFIGSSSYNEYIGEISLMAYLGFVNAGTVNAYKFDLDLNNTNKLRQSNAAVYSSLFRRYFLVLFISSILLFYGYVNTYIVILTGVIQLSGTIFTGYASRLGLNYFHYYPYIITISIHLLLVYFNIDIFIALLIGSIIGFGLINFIFWNKRLDSINRINIFKGKISKTLLNSGLRSFCLQIFIAVVLSLDIQIAHFFNRDFINNETYSVYYRVFTMFYSLSISMVAVFWAERINSFKDNISNKLHITKVSYKTILIIFLAFTLLFLVSNLFFSNYIVNDFKLFVVLSIKILAALVFSIISQSTITSKFSKIVNVIILFTVVKIIYSILIYNLLIILLLDSLILALSCYFILKSVKSKQ